MDFIMNVVNLFFKPLEIGRLTKQMSTHRYDVDNNVTNQYCLLARHFLYSKFLDNQDNLVQSQ